MRSQNAVTPRSKKSEDKEKEKLSKLSEKEMKLADYNIEPAKSCVDFSNSKLVDPDDVNCNP